MVVSLQRVLLGVLTWKQHHWTQVDLGAGGLFSQLHHLTTQPVLSFRSTPNKQGGGETN